MDENNKRDSAAVRKAFDQLPWPQEGFSGSSAGKESACNAGDPGSIPGLGRSPGEGTGYPLQYPWASLLAQMVSAGWVHALGLCTRALESHGSGYAGWVHMFGPWVGTTCSPES